MGKPTDQIHEIPINDILVDDDANCRDQIVFSDIAVLAKQIERMGLIQPVTVRRLDDGQLKMVCGHRRWHACKRLKKETIRGFIRDDLTDADAAAINLAENIERKNLTALEEAKALNRLLNEGYTAEELCTRLNRAPTWVQARLAILKLPELAQREVAQGNLNLKHVRDLVGLPEKIQYAKIKAIKERKQKLETAKGLRLNQKYRKKVSRTGKGKVQGAKAIANVRNYIYDLFGDSIEGAALAWAEGKIPYDRLESYIKDQAESFNVEFKTIEEMEI